MIQNRISLFKKTAKWCGIFGVIFMAIYGLFEKNLPWPNFFLLVSGGLIWMAIIAGCAASFYYCLNGYREQNLVYKSNDFDGDQTFTGKTARILSIIGMTGTGFFFILCLALGIFFTTLRFHYFSG
ncbi:MAG: hypothetical protein GY707_04415 [Desulfobacteraceae bacterium]|nr:hypothetical protein [Desulfobacteraceae bacterium]